MFGFENIKTVKDSKHNNDNHLQLKYFMIIFLSGIQLEWHSWISVMSYALCSAVLAHIGRIL